MANLLFFNVERGHRRPRKFRLSNNSLIDDYTDEELRARYRFGRQSILYITNLLARDLRRSTARNQFVCFIYLSEGRVPTLWDAIFDIKTKKLRNSLGFNTSAVIVYVSRG